MVNFIEAVKRPLKTDFMTLILGSFFMSLRVLGGVLTFALGAIVGGILSLAALLVHGLGIEASRQSMQKSSHMPVFEDYVDLFFSGLMVYVIGILYFLPAMIVMMLGIANSLPFMYQVMHSAVWEPVGAVQGLLWMVVHGALYGLVALILSILAILMAPIGIQFYAEKKQLGDAFRFSDILNVVATSNYWVGWIVIAAYGVVLLGLSIILSVLSFGVLLVPAFGVSSYLWLITAYTIFAEVTHEAHHGVSSSARTRATHHAKSKSRFAYKK